MGGLGCDSTKKDGNDPGTSQEQEDGPCGRVNGGELLRTRAGGTSLAGGSGFRGSATTLSFEWDPTWKMQVLISLDPEYAPNS